MSALAGPLSYDVYLAYKFDAVLCLYLSLDVFDEHLYISCTRVIAIDNKIGMLLRNNRSADRKAF